MFRAKVAAVFNDFYDYMRPSKISLFVQNFWDYIRPSKISLLFQNFYDYIRPKTASTTLELVTNTARYNKGFSMVEILIAILVFAILVIVGLTVYNGQRNAARDAAAKSAVNSALQAVRSIYALDGDYQTFHTTVYNNDTSGISFMPMPNESSLIVTSAWISTVAWSAAMSTSANSNSDPKQIYELGWHEQVVVCSKSQSSKSFCILDSRITCGDATGATCWYVPKGTFYGKAAAGAATTTAFNDAYNNKRTSW